MRCIDDSCQTTRSDATPREDSFRLLGILGWGVSVPPRPKSCLLCPAERSILLHGCVSERCISSRLLGILTVFSSNGKGKGWGATLQQSSSPP